MAELSCTCGPGESVAGTRQEIIEQRLAAHFGMPVPEIHALLDLHVNVLDAVLDMDDPPEGESTRRIAAACGRPEKWVEEFFDLWEFEHDALDRELPNPYAGLYVRTRGAEPE